MATKSNSAPKASTQSNGDIANGNILFTGFPGFLASRLLAELIPQQPDVEMVFLVQAPMKNLAHARLTELEQHHPTFAGRWQVLEGDISDPNLGLSPQSYTSLLESIQVVWHLAAIYDLAVDEQIAFRVNVEGTTHVLDFCQACKSFTRLNYISTCYVSGDRHGIIYESQLDEGQSHKNHYESTKFWAEAEVQRRMELIPTAILRPAIVVGDSHTGETDKFDGPYVYMNAFKKFPSWMPMARIGKGLSPINFVPVDYVSQTMAYLGLSPKATGKVFHIADPSPMRARDIIALILDSLNKMPPVVTLPEFVPEKLVKIDAIKNWLNIPEEAFAYINHDVQYDVSNTTEALLGTDIRCPHFSTYCHILIAYFLEHCDD